MQPAAIQVVQFHCERVVANCGVGNKMPSCSKSVSRPREFHPEPLRRTVHKSLDLHGSHYPTLYKGFVDVMSLFPATQVGDTRQPGNAAPSLHSHYRSFITTMSSPDPRSDIGILPRGFCHLSFPFSFRTRLSRSVPKPVLSSCHLYTGCHRVP